MNRRSVSVDRVTDVKVKSVPILRPSLQKALNGIAVVVGRSTRDGHGGKGRNELVVESCGLAVIEDVPDIEGSPTMQTSRVNFPSMGP
jgi:hypothetical protein